ncbi:MAG: Ig-like domain-containing protein, partial [Thermoplasmata archaeon]|nr:Ig-like domain-containing protein [Thermoplasmata archaeon]
MKTTTFRTLVSVLVVFMMLVSAAQPFMNLNGKAPLDNTEQIDGDLTVIAENRIGIDGGVINSKPNLYLKVIVATNDVPELANYLSNYNYEGIIGTQTSSRNGVAFPVLSVPPSAIEGIAALPAVLGVYDYVDPISATNTDGTSFSRSLLGLGPNSAIVDSLDIEAGSLYHGAEEAWANGYTGDGVKIATVTGGTDFGHPELAGRQATITNASSPYYGYPIAYDPASMSSFVESGLQASTLDPSESWYVNMSSTDRHIYHTVIIDGINDFWTEMDPHHSSQSVYPQEQTNESRASDKAEDISAFELDLKGLYTGSDSENWYLGFDVTPETDNWKRSFDVNYGLYIDTDNIVGSGAKKDPKGNLIASASIHRPEYAIYFHHVGVDWGIGTDGTVWSNNNTVENATFYSWFGGSWREVTMTEDLPYNSTVGIGPTAGSHIIKTADGLFVSHNGKDYKLSSNNTIFYNQSGYSYVALELINGVQKYSSDFLEFSMPREMMANAQSFHSILFSTGNNVSHAQDSVPQDLAVAFEGAAWDIGTTTLSNYTFINAPPQYVVTGIPSASGNYRIGLHPDQNLMNLQYGRPVAVLLTDYYDSGKYDAIYVDLDNDKSFADEIPMQKYGAYNDSLMIGPRWGTQRFENNTILHNNSGTWTWYQMKDYVDVVRWSNETLVPTDAGKTIFYLGNGSVNEPTLVVQRPLTHTYNYTNNSVYTVTGSEPTPLSFMLPNDNIIDFFNLSMDIPTGEPNAGWYDLNGTSYNLEKTTGKVTITNHSSFMREWNNVTYVHKRPIPINGTDFINFTLPFVPIKMLLLPNSPSEICWNNSEIGNDWYEFSPEDYDINYTTGLVSIRPLDNTVSGEIIPANTTFWANFSYNANPPAGTAFYANYTYLENVNPAYTFDAATRKLTLTEGLKAGDELSVMYSYDAVDEFPITPAHRYGEIIYNSNRVQLELRDWISNRDIDSDGGIGDGKFYPDISGGMAYFIADGVSPVPYMDMYWEWNSIENEKRIIPGNGDMIALFGEFAEGSAQGTEVGTAISGLGTVLDGNDNPLVKGMAPGAKLISIRGGAFASWYFAVEGYDGQIGTSDDAQIVAITSNFPVSNSGWDVYTKGAEYIGKYYAHGNVTFVAGTGDTGFGYGTAQSPGSSEATITAGQGTMFDYRCYIPKAPSKLARVYADSGPNPHSGDILPSSGRGPNMLGNPEPDVITISAFQFGGIPLNRDQDATTSDYDWFGGQWAWDLWSGPAVSASSTAGILALIYDAYHQKTGTYPDITVAKSLLKSGADNMNYDILTQGSGWSNADRSTKLAAGVDGIYLSRTYWVPGDYRGIRYEGFIKLMEPGETATETVTITNMNTITDASIQVYDSIYHKFGDYKIEMNMTRTYDDPDSPGIMNIEPFIAVGTELLKVTATSARKPIMQTYMAELFDWTDANENGLLDFPTEQNRMTYVIGSNSLELRYRDPIGRTTDGLAVQIKGFGGSGEPLDDWLITLEFFEKVDWSWLTLSGAPTTLAAGANATITLNLSVPSYADAGSYEGAVYINRKANEEQVASGAGVLMENVPFGWWDQTPTADFPESFAKPNDLDVTSDNRYIVPKSTKIFWNETILFEGVDYELDGTSQIHFFKAINNKTQTLVPWNAPYFNMTYLTVSANKTESGIPMENATWTGQLSIPNIATGNYTFRKGNNTIGMTIWNETEAVLGENVITATGGERKTSLFNKNIVRDTAAIYKNGTAWPQEGGQVIEPTINAANGQNTIQLSHGNIVPGATTLAINSVVKPQTGEVSVSDNEEVQGLNSTAKPASLSFTNLGADNDGSIWNDTGIWYALIPNNLNRDTFRIVTYFVFDNGIPMIDGLHFTMLKMPDNSTRKIQFSQYLDPGHTYSVKYTYYNNSLQVGQLSHGLIISDTVKLFKNGVSMKITEFFTDLETGIITLADPLGPNEVVEAAFQYNLYLVDLREGIITLANPLLAGNKVDVTFDYYNYTLNLQTGVLEFGDILTNGVVITANYVFGRYTMDMDKGIVKFSSPLMPGENITCEYYYYSNVIPVFFSIGADRPDFSFGGPDSTLYSFNITAGNDVAGNALIVGPVPNPWTFTVGNLTAPAITSTVPASGAVNVTLASTVIVTFSEAMNTGSVAYTCMPAVTGWSVVWSADNTVATYSHTNPFVENTTYTFQITAGTDVTGHALEDGMVPNPWTFTTVGVPPTITNTVPANGATGFALDSKVVVTFSEPMNTGTVTYTCVPTVTLWSVVWSGGNTIATYSHTNTFVENTLYTFQITAGNDANGVPLAAGAVQNPWTFTTFGAPTITNTAPANGASGVALTDNIVVTFSEAMNTGSVAYTCSPDPTGWSVVWSGGNTIATYSHSNPFVENTLHTFTITAGTDEAGNSLAAGAVPNPWTFTTFGAPTITNTVPANGANGVALTDNIVVTFSEAMNISSVAYTCSPDPTGWSVVWSGGNTIATYSHTNPFVLETYTFQITAGTDVAGNALVDGAVPNPWTFTTDNTAPTITVTLPANGATDIAMTADVVVTFSEAMNTTSVTYTCVPAVTVWPVVWSGSNTIATYSHSNPFVVDTTYTFQIAGGKDVNGLSLAAGAVPNPWTFTTIGAPEITATAPANGANGIALTASVNVTFSEAMNTGTVAFTCSPDPTGWTVIWYAGNTIANFSHSTNFIENTLYTFTITAGNDAIGIPLATGAIPNPWTFTTIGAPKVTATNPANLTTGVALTAGVVVTFSEAMNITTVTYTCIPAATVWSVVWSGGNTIATYNHTGAFTENTLYTFRITAGTDAAGNALIVGAVPNPWTFTTDKTAPTITSTLPVNTATGVALNTNVVVTFSEAMNIGTVMYTSAPNPGGWSVVWSGGNTIATYSHTNPFVENTLYTFKITGGSDANGVPLAAGAVPNPWTFTTTFTAPTIVNSVPADGATGVALDSKVVVTFSEAMNTGTVTYTSAPNPGGWSVVWSAGNTIATYSHTNAFVETTLYTFQITAGNDANGVPLTAGAVPNPWTFTTLAIPPTITNTNPAAGATNVPITSPIVVTFSEAMNITTVTYTCVPAVTGWSVVWSTGNTTATYSHSMNFAEMTYTFQITAGNDTNGVPLAAGAVPNPWTFTTVADLVPIISVTDPANVATGVALAADIVITFSEIMNTGTVTYACTPDPGGWSVVWSTGNTTATYSHSMNFTEMTSYTFQITAGNDANGVPLAAGAVPNPWTFMTTFTAPTMVNSVPADGATGVALTDDVVVTFSEAMNITTVTYTCVPAVTGWSVVWSAGNTTATYSHSMNFAEMTSYTFQITAGNDTNGVPLAAGAVPNPWTFTTLTTLPTITNTVPANGATGVALTSKVVVTFSEAMNITTVTYTCVPAVTVWSVAWSAGNTIATYTHSNPFTENKPYTFKITAGKDVAGNALIAGAPNPWTFTTVGVPPIIAFTNPANGTITAALTANIVVTFSEAMNIGTVTYTCTPDPGGWSVLWSSGNKIATYTHSNPFVENTVYNFTITAGNDANGVPLAAGARPNPWTFTTLGAPTITYTAPSNGAIDVALTATVNVTFSEAMNTGSVTYTCLPAVTGWSVVWSEGNRVATYSHTGAFVENTVYTFKITAGTDVAGNALIAGAKPNPWTFTTVGVPPTITLTNPANGATDIALTATVVVTFSEAMITSSVMFTCSPDPTSWSVVWSVGNTVATYSYVGGFYENTVYTFEITAGTDIAGNDLTAGAVPNPWTFTTIGAPIIVDTNPAEGMAGIALTAPIVVTFSEPMNTASVTYTCVPAVTGWSVVWSAGNTVATYSHTGAFVENIVYTFNITAGIDATGIALIAGPRSNPWMFTTVGISPTIISTTPTNGATGIAPTSTIVVTFSEAMDTSSITFTCTPDPTGWSVVWSAGNTVATFSHSVAFTESISLLEAKFAYDDLFRYNEIRGGYGNEGDWRYVFLDVKEQGKYAFPTDNERLYVDVAWEHDNSDVDVQVFGGRDALPTWQYDNFPQDRYGPHSVSHVGGSDVTSGFFTTTGGPEEITAPKISPGVNVIGLHTVGMNGSAECTETFTAQVGTMYIDSTEVKVVTNQYVGETTINMNSNLEWSGVGGIAAGPSAPESLKDQSVAQDDDDWANYDSFEDQLASGKTVYTRTIVDCLIFDVHIWGQDTSPDLDIGVFLDGSGDGEKLDGKVQADEFFAMDADGDADEQVKLIAPPDGKYLIVVFGFTLTTNPGLFDMDITIVQGTGFDVHGKGINSLPTEMKGYFSSNQTEMPYNQTNLKLSWNLPGSATGTLQGALYIGPGNGPMCMLVPIELTIDTNAPEFSNPSPASGAFINNRRPDIVVSVSDYDRGELESSTMKMYLDGTDVTAHSSIRIPLVDDDTAPVKGYPDGTGLYKPNLPLADGAHSVIVIIEDKAGNEEILNWAFTVDSVSPQFEVTYPSEEVFYTNQDSIEITGFTEYGLIPKLIGASVNESNLREDGSFSILVPLFDGMNSLTLKTTDPAGNSKEIYRVIIRDNEASEFTSVRFSTGYITNMQYTTLSGKMSEPGMMTANGAVVAVNSDGTFEKLITLAEGRNTIHLEFTDLSGNMIHNWQNVTLDTVAPTISLTSAGTKTHEQSYTLAGNVEAGSELFVNGKRIDVGTRQSSSDFNTTLTLSQGMNTIVIEVQDSAGNIAELRHVVEYDTDTGGVNYGAIGIMVILLVLGLLLGIFLGRTILGGAKEPEAEEDIPEPEDMDVSEEEMPIEEELPEETLDDVPEVTDEELPPEPESLEDIPEVTDEEVPEDVSSEPEVPEDAPEVEEIPESVGEPIPVEESMPDELPEEEVL